MSIEVNGVGDSSETIVRTPLTNNTMPENAPAENSDQKPTNLVKSQPKAPEQKIDLNKEPTLSENPTDEEIEKYVEKMQEYNEARIKAAANKGFIPENNNAQKEAIDRSLENIQDSAESESGYKPNEEALNEISELNKKIKTLETQLEATTDQNDIEKDRKRIELAKKKAEYNEQVIKYIEGDSEKDQMRYGIGGSAGAIDNKFVQEAKEVLLTISQLRETGKIEDIVAYIEANIKNLSSTDTITIKNILQSKIDAVLFNKALNDPEKIQEARSALGILNNYQVKLGVNVGYLSKVMSDPRLNIFNQQKQSSTVSNQKVA